MQELARHKPQSDHNLIHQQHVPQRAVPVEPGESHVLHERQELCRRPADPRADSQAPGGLVGGVRARHGDIIRQDLPSGHARRPGGGRWHVEHGTAVVGAVRRDQREPGHLLQDLVLYPENVTEPGLWCDRELVYDAVGTLSDISNNLVLDSLTNGLKTTIWQGTKNIVDPKKWTKTGHAGRLGTLSRIKAVFDYLNTVDAQNALSSAYGNMHSLTPFLTAALLKQNSITYDTTKPLTEFARGHFDYMVANTITWVTPKLAEEATYWASAAAATYCGATTAQNNLALVQDMQKMAWAALITTWLV